MTDSGRKDLSDKLSQSAQPDGSKSTLDKISDNVTGTADKVARDVVPDSEKSTSQSLQDKVSREKDHHTGHNEGLVDKVKHAFGADKH